MGCASSSPTQDDTAVKTGKPEFSNVVAGGSNVGGGSGGGGGDGGAAASSGTATPKGPNSTRARRLSCLPDAAGAGAGVQAQDEGIQAGSPRIVDPGDDEAAARAKKTRSRRLSYFTNEANRIPVPEECEAADAEAVTYQDSDVVGAAQYDGGVGTSTSNGSGAITRVSVACMSRAGKEPGFKKTNQDNCFAFEKYILEGQSLFGAMDGHGPHGHLVSGYVKQHLPMILVNRLTTEKDDMQAISAAFLEAQASLESTSRIDCEFSGTTAVVSLLKGNTLTTGWVGDSRGVIGRETQENGWEAIELTEDHKPANPEEQARIIASNGRVERLVDEVGEAMGPYRVWLQYAWIPGLAMSRALGDVLAHSVGVSSQPEHSVVELDPSHKFMILASDGVWEFINSAEAVDIVRQFESIDEACRAVR
uniref:PPM-type phosphatase domain-containing protein n=1 Tax=Chlamydomonas euryale TaxID=1486919 RepID=A0A7R9YVZ8_9CHLO|mmetsp:Transcript_2676/g.7224  ORF Transcript_2676/g.7224 Transcript_2676/m.7224 type:complete len:421 (+) Transcript_2676:275-1537(+)